MRYVQAKVVDSTHLELSKPINIPAGREVKISVLSQELLEQERKEWEKISLQGISDAYAESEPEYPISLVQEPNAEYGNERG